MHRPPPVSMDLASRRQCLAGMGAIWCGAVAALVAWWFAGQPAADVLWPALLASLAAAAAALRSLARLGTGELRWAEGQWVWQPPGSSLAGEIMVRADFQSALLLEFLPTSGAAGVWMVAIRQPGAAWLPFRRAIHGAAGLTAPGADRSTVAWPYGGTA